MTAPVVSLDFAAQRLRPTFGTSALLMLGVIALVGTGFEYYSLNTQRAGLELKLAASLRQSRPDLANEAHTARANAAAADIATELGTPWTAMLLDLELAARDSQGRVAVLSVEPDHDKHRVRVTGESRDMKEVLAYLTRLQSGFTLQFPMLDSHEIVADDKEHPVRFTLSADWRATP